MLKKVGVALFVFVLIGQGTLLAKASLRNTFERQLVNDIQTKLIKRYPTLVKKDISIRIKNKSQLQKIPVTAKTYNSGLDFIRSILGETDLFVEFYNQENYLLDTIKFKVFVNGKITVYSPKKDLKRRSVLQEDVIKPKKVSLLNVNPRAIFNKEDLIGKEVKYSLRETAVISKHHIKEKPIVNIGDIVAILMKKPGIEIKVKGKALDDGSFGDMIRVRTSLKDKKIIKGKVIDENNIMVDLFN